MKEMQGLMKSNKEEISHSTARDIERPPKKQPDYRVKKRSSGTIIIEFPNQSLYGM